MTSIIKQLEEKKDSLNIEFYKPVNEEIVDRFEKEYITLPTEYLDFIRKSDGLGATEVFDGTCSDPWIIGEKGRVFVDKLYKGA